MTEKIFASMLMKPTPTKRWAFIPGSFFFHLLLIGLVVVIPLMKAYTDLPPAKVVDVIVTAPNQLRMPHGPGKGSGTKGAQVRAKRARVETVAKSNSLVAPVTIPDEIVQGDITDSIGTGPDDGVIGALEKGPGDVTDTQFFNHKPDMQRTFIRVEQVPRLIKKVTPVYPEAAARARLQGQVVIEAQTDIYGRVAELTVISGNPLLVKAAEEAVRQWVYEPYIINGVPRPVRFAVTLDFTLTH